MELKKNWLRSAPLSKLVYSCQFNTSKKTHTKAYVAITLKKLFTRYNEDCFLEKARDREKSFDFCVVFLV